MSALELYAKEALRTKGIEHMHAIHSLRRYINLTPEEQLIRYINMIYDLAILRILLEAGMRGDAWKTLVTRADILRKEKEGGM